MQLPNLNHTNNHLSLEFRSMYVYHVDHCQSPTLRINPNILKSWFGLHLQIFITTLYSIKDTNGRTHVSNLDINRHALPITITKSRKMRFSIRFLHTFHRRFDDAM